MLKKLYERSEVWFAVTFILIYVIGNSFCMQASDGIGMEMILTIPFNLAVLGVLFFFVKKEGLTSYYGLQGVHCKAGKVLYYIPLILIATVNLWMGIRLNMDPIRAGIYFLAMVLTGFLEEMLFRGLLLKAMCRDNVRQAVIVTSILFGVGHIVNLLNGNSTSYVETICQLFYAAAIGFLLAAVLFAAESLVPCMLTHAILNALSTFSNEEALERIQIPVSIALCVISAVSAWMIYQNIRRME